MRRILKEEEGQSTIEFLLTMIFTLSLLFMFIFIGINFTSGYLAHYAAFAASRSYLVFESNSNEPGGGDSPAEVLARRVFSSFRIGDVGIKNPNQFPLEFNLPGVAKYEYVGVRYQFQVPITTLKLFGPTLSGTLMTESYLGREPTRATCFERVCRAMEEANGGAVSCRNPLAVYTLYDNGC